MHAFNRQPIDFAALCHCFPSPHICSTWRLHHSCSGCCFKFWIYPGAAAWNIDLVSTSLTRKELCMCVRFSTVLLACYSHGCMLIVLCCFYVAWVLSCLFFFLNQAFSSTRGPSLIAMDVFFRHLFCQFWYHVNDHLLNKH